MSGQILSRGTRIRWNGFEYLIEERLSDGQIRLLNKHSEERRSIEEATLIEETINGNLIVLGYNNESQILDDRIQKNRVSDFSALDENDPRRISTLRKYAYVKRLLSEKKSGFSNEEICEVIEKVAEEINDLSLPSVRSVRRWTKLYIDSGEDIRALIGADKSKGNRTRKYSTNADIAEEVYQQIIKSINAIYLTPQQNSVEAVIAHIEYQINKVNETRSERNKLPIPDPSSVYRIVAQLDEYEVDKARKGEKYAHMKHKTLNKALQPTRPLERVECDDTRIDLMVVDPESGLPLGRPWLMILIDVYTKMILGYYLSFYPPSYVTVMMAMKHAIRPKNYLKEKYPGIVNSWDAHGVFETLVIDNAKFYHGKALEDAGYQLGMDIQYAPVQTPWFKPSIERIFKSLNTGLFHQQPGTTFSNIFEKMDYDPKKHAVISLDLLDEILHKWIVDIYSQRIHEGIKNIPALVWKESISRYPLVLPPAHTKLEILLGKVTYRKISGSIIHFKNLEYSDQILTTIKTNSDKEIKIKYDPTDLGMIYVYDQFMCRFIPVPAVNQEYAKGLTEWQHEVICRFVRRRNQERVDRNALAEAKEYIRRKVAEAFGARPKKISSSSRLNKWRAFDDPTDARIIYDKNDDSDTGRSSGQKTKFVPLNDHSPRQLDWSDGKTWDAEYGKAEEN